MTPLALAALLAAAPADFKAGVAAAPITPAEPLWLAGYAARDKPAEGKVHDLFVKALALEDAAGGRLVLVTSDLIGLSRDFSERVAGRLRADAGLPRERLMLTASHTHTGPVMAGVLTDMYPLTPEMRAAADAYTRRVEDAFVAVARAALADLKPATLSVGSGTCRFAVNRRQATARGVTIGRNPDGPVDHSVPLLRVDGPDGRPRAVVFGYACHNTTLQDYRWCGDYAGFAQPAVEARFPGATAFFWAGCGADANPDPRGTPELAERHGKELADAVAAVAAGPLTPVAGRLTARYATVPLELEQPPTREQLRADLLGKNLAARRRAERFLAGLDAGRPLPGRYDHYPVQAWALGDGPLWVALGGEVVVDYALRLRKELGRPLWVTAYANDVMAYIASKRVLAEGGYEADSSMVYYGLPGRWKPSVEDVIVGAVRRLAE